jgi:pyruvate,water dikinase
MSALAEARAEDVDLEELVETQPVVLALTPPHIGDDPTLAGLVPAAVPSPSGPVSPGPDGDAAVVREALRLRARWVQELTARAVWELGRRLVCVGVLPTRPGVRLLALDELRGAALQRSLPGDLAERTDPSTISSKPLPAQFRLSRDDRPVAIAVATTGDGGIGAGGGDGTGRAHLGGDPPPGAVLVVTHLDPRLATVIPRLGGLVAETGSPLSHLAILAREHGVPTVVGHAGATSRYQEGDLLAVDGAAGTVRLTTATVITLPTPRVVDLSGAPVTIGVER